MLLVPKWNSYQLSPNLLYSWYGRIPAIKPRGEKWLYSRVNVPRVFDEISSDADNEKEIFYVQICSNGRIGEANYDLL